MQKIAEYINCGICPKFETATLYGTDMQPSGDTTSRCSLFCPKCGLRVEVQHRTAHNVKSDVYKYWNIINTVDNDS